MENDRDDVEVVTAPERRVVGLARHFTMDTRHEISQLWQAFFAEQRDIPGVVPGAMFGVSFSNDAEGAFRYAVGLEQSKEAGGAPLPEGLCTVVLSAGDYAVLRRFGPVAGLPADFDWVFDSWLPASGLTLREGAVFERYPDDPQNGPAGMAYEIWAPVARPG